jgi:hypothetical protein
MSTIYTTNMACALYLVQQGNIVRGLEMFVDLPYAHEECRFTFEGERAEEDFRYYHNHNMSDLDLSSLPLLFRAVEAFLPVREVAR